MAAGSPSYPYRSIPPVGLDAALTEYEPERAKSAAALACDAVEGPDVRLTAFVRGRVQGVGFRWWVRAKALELGLVGSATNLADGRVQVVVEGPESACRALSAALAGRGSPGHVVGVSEQWTSARGDIHGFVES